MKHFMKSSLETSSGGNQQYFHLKEFINPYVYGVILLLFGLMNLDAQSLSPFHKGTLQLNGIPLGSQVEMSYRSQTEVFYLLPDGTSMRDYNDLDKTYMRPYEKDERIVVGQDGSGSPLYVREVLNPTIQFNDRNVPYTHMVMHGNYAAYYGENGDILTRVPIGDSVTIGSPPSSSGDNMNPGSNFADIGRGKFKLTTIDFEVTLDTINRTIFMEEFDSLGVWMVRNFLQMDQTDRRNHTPVYRMQAERIQAPSGDCVFKIMQKKNSEFYNQNNAGIRESKKISNLFFNEIDIYPNPASQRIWIELPKGFKMQIDENIALKIYSMSGQLLRDVQLPAKRISEISTSEFQTGMYIISLRHNDTMWTDKFIIK